MTEYPQFRKYVGVDTWFKIISANEFIEIQKLGQRYLKTTVVATQFPEKQLIRDMLDCFENRWEVISETVFLAVET